MGHQPNMFPAEMIEPGKPWESPTSRTPVVTILAMRQAQRMASRPIEKKRMPRLSDERRALILKQFRRLNHA